LQVRVGSSALEGSAAIAQSKESLHSDKERSAVLAKITAKNQLTLPQAITNAIGPVEYFDVQTRDGEIVLTPVRIQRADAVRAKLAALGVREQDVADAVRWARPPVRKTRK
jgi:hypothetical protein